MRVEDKPRISIFRKSVEVPAMRWVSKGAGGAGECREDTCLGGGQDRAIGSNGGAKKVA